MYVCMYIYNIFIYYLYMYIILYIIYIMFMYYTICANTNPTYIVCLCTIVCLIFIYIHNSLDIIPYNT
jgi:hypothetical protein